MQETESPSQNHQKISYGRETIYSGQPYGKSNFDDEVVDAITDGKKFLIVSDESVEVHGAKTPKVVKRRLYEYVSGGMLTHAFSFNEADGMFVASMRDSESESTVVYEGHYFSEMKEALGGYALAADALKAA